MGFFSKKFSKKTNKDAPVQHSQPQYQTKKPSKIIAIGAKTGYLDVYSAMLNIAYRDAERFATTRNDNMLDSYILSFYKPPLKLEKVAYCSTDNNISFYFSYPIPKELEKNNELMEEYDLIDLYAAAIHVKYFVKQIFLRDNAVFINESPQFRVYLVDDLEFDEEYAFEDEVQLSPRKFYVDEANIFNTTVFPPFLSDAPKTPVSSSVRNKAPIHTPTVNEQKKASDILLMSGLEFEHFCREVLLANGFQRAEVTQSSHDYGGDILAQKDQVKYVIQCKKYSSPVGIDAVQQVIGSRSIYNCHVAAVLTNSTFTDSAVKLAEKNNVILWDKTALSRMMSQLHSASQDINSTHLSNGDSITVSREDSLTLIMIAASSKRYANIAIAALAIIADKYSFDEFGISVTFDNQTRKIVAVDGIVGCDYEVCTWISTVSQPLSNLEKDYVNSIIHFIERVVGAKKKNNSTNDSDAYCEHNITFTSTKCIMTQKMCVGDPYSFQMGFKPTSADEAILSYLFFNDYFSKQIRELQYDYSFAIIKDNTTWFIYKEAPNEEITVPLDANGKPTEQAPLWTGMIESFDTQSDANKTILRSFCSCYIEFINKINLLSLFDD